MCGRVGGGFGGKQEMLVEDVVALAVLRTGRPVQLEFTRDGTVRRAPRHAMRMRVRVKGGATRTGISRRSPSTCCPNTGAYGNHGAGVLHHGCDESIALYRCAEQARRTAWRSTRTRCRPAHSAATA